MKSPTESAGIAKLADGIFDSVKKYTTHVMDQRCKDLQEQNDRMAEHLRALMVRVSRLEDQAKAAPPVLRKVG